MGTKKEAAIDMDTIRESELGKVSAADFLSALDAGGLSAKHLTVWPEKKKVELWVEPENFSTVRVKDIVGVIRNEKKKVERELQYGNFMQPQDITYDDLLIRLTGDIERRLRGVRGVVITDG